MSKKEQISWDGSESPWTSTKPDKLYLQSGQFLTTLKTSLSVGGLDTETEEAEYECGDEEEDWYWDRYRE